ncbi:DNAJ heat shock N-terminal domain-containing protein [Euphorbia peplus]|nr:DNAJ heat shock N-terminal domain-containing protein [Euphorbia peplus]
MEANIEEALRARDTAEKRFSEKDFAGAKNYALKAKTLCPGLEGISQMVATFEVYIASEGKCNGAIDYYSVLGLKPSADRDAVKKQYRKMAVLLHPDKNKTVGADGAFKLVSEAWTMLSDSLKRKSFDFKRNKQMKSCPVQTNMSSVHAAGVAGFSNCSNSNVSHGLDTFWTVCTSCKVQYEYLRKYVNKRLSCKNCRGTFVAVETGKAPVNGSFPYSPWSYSPGSGYSISTHGYDGVTYVPTSPTVFTGNGVPGLHTGHGYEYVSNVSFQWSSYSGTTAGVVGHNGPSAVTTDAVYQVNGNVTGARANAKSTANGKRAMKTTVGSVNSNVVTSYNDSSVSKACRPDKRRKVVVAAGYSNGHEENGLKPASEIRFANGNTNVDPQPRLPTASELPARRMSVAPAFDARKLLIDMARADIKKKLQEMSTVSKDNVERRSREVEPVPKFDNSNAPGNQTKQIKSEPVSIVVPDPDFHDFDKDRSEECFKPKQIWALYDEDDGMPRLYCLIRQVVSVNPFKILITYLNSKTDTEFGQVNWLDSGFTKSCGHFRAWHTDLVDQVNIFSHLLKDEKAGRGGCVRIYPRSGDIWAVYRNWSRDWDRSTPDDVRHQYEMVEVLDDYSQDLGICVAPLIKLTGFKTVYQRNMNKDAIRWIPRREMLRFSHQVPSWLLEGGRSNLPEKCWDLDPAATPDELLNATAEAKA